MKLIILCLSFLIGSAFALETKVAIITSEFDKNTGTFLIETDDSHKILSIRYINRLPNGGIFTDNTYPAETVINDGVVLEERNNLEIIRLGAENFDLMKGGTVKLNYLYNGVTGTRYVKKLDLLNNNGVFTLQDKTKVINRLYIRAHNTPVGTVGVKEITTSYVPEKL